tara:strand:- start:564 stop:1316 length:753 start_codon:yes stop_codon:yes gene_type:complete
MWWFELILTCLFASSLLVTLVGVFFKSTRDHAVVKLARSYLPVFMLVFVVRSFIFQPFKVVSGSLEPTVLVGDFLGVNQSAYGLRLPLTHTKILKTGNPQLGEIALFYYPMDETKVFVKRVVGTPGDHIIYKDKQLTINGVLMTQVKDGIGFDEEPGELSRLMSQRIEDLKGIKHKIFVDEKRLDEVVDMIVPEGKYFMMGDNRDNSGDSRQWGYVDDSLLIGRAFRILASWDTDKWWFRTSRFGSKFYL